MHPHPLRHINNQLDIRIVVIIRPPRYLSPSSVPIIPLLHFQLTSTHLNILIRHPNIIRIRLQILRRRHHRKLYRPLIPKRLVRPLPNTTDLLNRRNTVVRNQHLSPPISPISTPTKEREGQTEVITVCPSFAATKSLTILGGAFSRRFPPMKWGGSLKRFE